jgi:glycosyltransferase involved in cell wall biosynthesis
LVALVKPDLIHSHFVTTTCLLRLALGKRHPTPRIYQVAGPLHLEHWWSRRFELGLAGPADVWIGSSQCISQCYRQSGVPKDKLFLSYYGFETRHPQAPSLGAIRRAAGAQDGDILVGNISWMYPPKVLLGQRVGLKCHEDIIEALCEVTQQRANVLGVFVGGPWNNANWYETKLKRLASKKAGDRIRFTGALLGPTARQAWGDFGLAVHVPLSENCGGVVEPLNARVPVIASAVGGLPEVIFNHRTGLLVTPRQPRILARTILGALDQPDECRRMAELGKRLVDTMFDVERTAREVYAIYCHVLDPIYPAPPPFDSAQFLTSC